MTRIDPTFTFLTKYTIVKMILLFGQSNLLLSSKCYSCIQYQVSDSNCKELADYK